MKIAIIGGGVCGLTLANVLEKHRISYELFEKSLCGRKLLASGNGKANLANRNIKEEDYNHFFGYKLVEEYHSRLFDFFNELGLYTKTDAEGRVYPYSESSMTVFQCLTKNLHHIVENFLVQSISRINQKYYINEVRGPFDYVVLATGSFASFTPKKQKDFYGPIENLGLKISSPTPSLVGFQLAGDIKRLNGVRIKCKTSLFQKDSLIHQESGEVILKADGISGICVMNLSSRYARLKDKKDCYIVLDLLPGIEINLNSIEELMGVLHPKLFEYFKNFTLEEVKGMLHHFKFLIQGVYDFEFAQVVSGGVELEEITETLSLKKDSHIFIGGELMDIDGVCGGYNLMFAFCCGLKIGEELCNIK